MLAREQGHPSPCEDERNENESELPPLEEVPLGDGDGACHLARCDAKKEDEAYIEALEPMKFDTAELVVRKELVLCSHFSPVHQAEVYCIL